MGNYNAYSTTQIYIYSNPNRQETVLAQQALTYRYLLNMNYFWSMLQLCCDKICSSYNSFSRFISDHILCK